MEAGIEADRPAGTHQNLTMAGAARLATQLPGTQDQMGSWALMDVSHSISWPPGQATIQVLCILRAPQWCTNPLTTDILCFVMSKSHNWEGNL